MGHSRILLWLSALVGLAASRPAAAQEAFTCANTYLSTYSWQSNAGTTSESNPSTGLYTDTFGGLSSTAGGNAMVTAFGPTSGANPYRCNLDTWGTSGGSVNVKLRCYDTSGNLVNNDHNVSFFQNSGGFLGSANGAYLWSDNLSMSGYPNSTYSFNSSSGFNYVVHSGTGNYTVELPGVYDASYLGAVHVVAHDDGASSSGKFCKIGDWTNPSGSDVYVYVKCYDHTGTAADSRFSLAYSAVAPIAGLSGAWARCDQEMNTSGYSPTARNYFDNCNAPVSNGSVTAKKLSTGQYSVTFANLESHVAGSVTSHVQVTAWDKDTAGTNTNFCNVETWSGNNPVTVYVNCFNTSGNLSDTKFVISFTNDQSSCI